MMIFEKVFPQRPETFSNHIYHHARKIQYVKVTTSKFNIQSNKNQ